MTILYQKYVMKCEVNFQVSPFLFCSVLNHILYFLIKKCINIYPYFTVQSVKNEFSIFTYCFHWVLWISSKLNLAYFSTITDKITKHRVTTAAIFNHVITQKDLSFGWVRTRSSLRLLPNPKQFLSLSWKQFILCHWYSL